MNPVDQRWRGITPDAVCIGRYRGSYREVVVMNRDGTVRFGKSREGRRHILGVPVAGAVTGVVAECGDDRPGRWRKVTSIPFSVSSRTGISGGIDSGDAGIDYLVVISDQIGTGHVNAEDFSVAICIQKDLARIGDVVNRQGDGVVNLGIATHPTSDCDYISRFGGIDNVVGSDLGIKRDGRDRCNDIDRVMLAIRVDGRAKVAGTIEGSDAGMDCRVTVGNQGGTGYVDAEMPGSIDRSGEGAGEVIVGERQGDNITIIKLTCDPAGDRNVSDSFSNVDGAVAGNVCIKCDSRNRGLGVDVVSIRSFGTTIIVVAHQVADAGVIEGDGIARDFFATLWCKSSCPCDTAVGRTEYTQ